MALADDVQDRIPTARLVRLTRPGTKSATTVDTTLLGQAVDDTEADFEIYAAGLSYDSTDKRHVRVGVEGVLYHLHRYVAPEGAKVARMRDAYLALLERLAQVTNLDAIEPETDGQYTPTPDRPEGVGTVRPPFDDARFRRFTGKPPRSRGSLLTDDDDWD